MQTKVLLLPKTGEASSPARMRDQLRNEKTCCTLARSTITDQ